jgi:uncharacterized protein (TIGR03066 family)
MRVSRLAAVALVLLLVPACSSNRGKIVGKWESTGGSVPLPGGAKMILEFTSNGKMSMTISAGIVNKTITGKYSLGMLNSVTLYDLSEALSGRTKHVEQVKITGDELKMTDSDGKFMTFKRMK